MYVCINRFCSLDDEIALRLKKAMGAFSALKYRVWPQRGLKKSTKLEVYNACVLACLLYSCETWVVYRRHLKQLERFHQRCLRSSLRYPLDNPHSRHRSLGESEYDQHRSTYPSTSSSLGGPRYTA